MAKSQQTFNKIEKEKKRLKKREEKQKKKDERKANPTGSSFDIAYVDENGNLSDTPPDPANKVVIEIEDIEIGIPKKEDSEEQVKKDKEGKVSFYDTSKGFGFIVDTTNQEKYFFHVSGLIDEVGENDLVTYELERGQKGMNAVRVKKI